MKQRLAIFVLALSLFVGVSIPASTPAFAGACASHFTHYGAYQTPYGYMYSALELNISGVYPNCQYQYKLTDYYRNNSGVQRPLDVWPIQLRWWVCGSGPTGAGWYGTNVPGNAIQNSPWLTYGTCGPQADNGGNREAPAGTGYYVNPYVSF